MAIPLRIKIASVVIATLYLFIPEVAASVTIGTKFTDTKLQHIALEVPAGVPVMAPKAPEVAPKRPKVISSNKIKAYVTGYNTVAAQTDSSPCNAAGGNICGRKDTVACPAHIPLHTWVSISGKQYECMDRTHSKHNGRFDVSCDKDMQCPFRLTGWRTVTILK